MNLKAHSRQLWINSLVFFWISFFNISQSNAANIPSDDKILIEDGTPTQYVLPSTFQVVVWNIHKADSEEKWQKDFLNFSKENELLLIQEGYRNHLFEETIGQLTDRFWIFATSFIYKGFNTGVLTSTKTKPQHSKWLRSPGREPILKSPKMTLVNIFDLDKTGQRLLVANIHGINFVRNNHFFQQISQVAREIENHDGPVIFAGDFNTWNGSRLQFLMETCKKLGLQEIVFKNDTRKRKLDHIFYRHITPIKAEILNNVESSDHLPLKVVFQSIQ